MAQLLDELRKLLGDPTKTLMAPIKPEYFDSIVKVTRSIGGFNMVNVEGESLVSFKTPSLPLKIGYAILKCMQIIKSGCAECIGDGNQFCVSFTIWNGIQKL